MQPHLQTAALSLRSGRVLHSKTVRKMLTMSHGAFCERLQSAAARHAGRHVRITTEPGTSKTCTRCGFWHAALGSSKTFSCPACGVVVDRDVAGARNNFFAAYGAALGIGWGGDDSGALAAGTR